MRNGTAVPLFPVYIYHGTASIDEETRSTLFAKLLSIFDSQSGLPQHPLEVGLGDSTAKTERSVTELLYSDAVAPLARCVLASARQYWDDVLRYERGASLKIVQCWANIHHKGGMTLEHNHSPIHLNAVFYLNVPEHSGPLTLLNPLEYAVKQSPLAHVEETLEHHVDVRAGDLVIMPGWLKHYVPASRSDQPRIVLTFNINGALESHYRPGLLLDGRSESEALGWLHEVGDKVDAASRATGLIARARAFDLSDVRRRFVEDNRGTLEYALRVESEVLRFLVLSSLYPRAAFPMGGQPDLYWHLLILHTRKYEMVCNVIAGSYIHHQPASAEQVGSAVERDRMNEFFRCYGECFGTCPPVDVWPFSEFEVVHIPL